MPTREIEHCLYRLRGLAETLKIVIGQEGLIGTIVRDFLAEEIVNAIADLEDHLPRASMIREDCRSRLTCWPEYITDDADAANGWSSA